MTTDLLIDVPAAMSGTGREPARAELKWRCVVLVCGDCEQRKDGPRHLDAKAVRRELKHGLRHAGADSRVVTTTCLGPCVKKALTVVAVGSAAQPGPLAYAVGRQEELADMTCRIAGVF